MLKIGLYIDSHKQEILEPDDNNLKLLEELNNNNNNNNVIKNYEESESIINETPIQQFYKDQVIFITGGTGFVGKVLIEKLLRRCSDVKRIFILVRQKKGKQMAERIQDLLNDSVFDSIRTKLWKLENKIIGVAGDCSLKNLGMSDDDINLLKKEVSIVFHVAATIRFNEKLKQAVATNIQSTLSIIDLCKGMQHLKSFIHVSTAYANCFTSEIEEKFYDYSINYKTLLYLVNSLPEETVNAITPQIIKSWPNTYTFTKALAEALVRAESENLPIGIFRPGIVISAAEEPIPGWVDNYNGPTGMLAGAASGVVRTIHIDSNIVANLVPVDLTVNAILASAWDVANQTDRRGEDMLIYNYTSTCEAPLSWGTFEQNAAKHIKDYPPKSALWCHSMQLTRHKLLYKIYAFFLHWIPGFLFDLVARTTGQKPRLQAAYEKIHKMSDVLNHFCMNEWTFKNDNVQNMWNRLDLQDRKLFKFSMRDFNWPKYFPSYVEGIRVFLFKDGLNTLETSKTKYNRFVFIHNLIFMSLGVFAGWTAWKVFSMTIVPMAMWILKIIYSKLTEK